MKKILTPQYQEKHPEKQIRAYYNENFIRVYQAYSDEIADSAVSNNTFVSPPFKMARMTWIKPSFFWMMYRAGWANKDDKQKRILAIDITHEGFLWALSNSCPSSFKSDIFTSYEQWQKQKENSPVRIQWDPERDFRLNKLDHRAIQIGLTGQAVHKYTQDWIVNITDITTLAQQIKTLIDNDKIDQALQLVPKEQVYNLPSALAAKLTITN